MYLLSPFSLSPASVLSPPPSLEKYCLSANDHFEASVQPNLSLETENENEKYEATGSDRDSDRSERKDVDVDDEIEIDRRGNRNTVINVSFTVRSTYKTYRYISYRTITISSSSFSFWPLTLVLPLYPLTRFCLSLLLLSSSSSLSLSLLFFLPLFNLKETREEIIPLPLSLSSLSSVVLQFYPLLSSPFVNSGDI